MEIHYFHKPTSITTSADGTSWLGTNAESALLYGCLVEAYTFLKGDPDLMQVYIGRYEEALRDLQEARRIARNNFKIREIITERILILQTYVAPQRRRS